MDKERVLLGLARRLDEAALARDWEALSQTYFALGPELQGLASAGQWSTGERRALARLHRAHQEAHASCREGIAALSATLKELSAGKDGWMAYALNGEMEERST